MPSSPMAQMSPSPGRRRCPRQSGSRSSPAGWRQRCPADAAPPCIRRHRSAGPVWDRRDAHRGSDKNVGRLFREPRCQSNAGSARAYARWHSCVGRDRQGFPTPPGRRFSKPLAELEQLGQGQVPRAPCDWRGCSAHALPRSSGSSTPPRRPRTASVTGARSSCARCGHWRWKAAARWGRGDVPRDAAHTAGAGAAASPPDAAAATCTRRRLRAVFFCGCARLRCGYRALISNF